MDAGSGGELEQVRDNPHLWPRAWWRFERAEWRLAAVVARPHARSSCGRRASCPCERASARSSCADRQGRTWGSRSRCGGGSWWCCRPSLLANCRPAQPGAGPSRAGGRLEGRCGSTSGGTGCARRRPPRGGAARWRLTCCSCSSRWSTRRRSDAGAPAGDAVAGGGRGAGVGGLVPGLARAAARPVATPPRGRLVMVQRAAGFDAEAGKRLPPSEAEVADGAELLVLAARVAARTLARGERTTR